MNVTPSKVHVHVEVQVEVQVQVDVQVQVQVGWYSQAFFRGLVTTCCFLSSK